MSTNAITISVSDYPRQANNFQRFVDVLGKDASSYVQSVIIAANSTEDLRRCTPRSIFQSALRAASLGLSCDPAQREAWLVPYNIKVKTFNGHP